MKEKKQRSLVGLLLIMFVLFGSQSCSKTDQLPTPNGVGVETRTTAFKLTPTSQKLPKLERTLITSEVHIETSITSTPINTPKGINLTPTSFWGGNDIFPDMYLIYTTTQGFEISSSSSNIVKTLPFIKDEWANLSPDKKFIAYTRSGFPYLYEIETGHEIPILSVTGCIMPDWSPDSKNVIFSCSTSDGSDLFLFSLPALISQRITKCAETKDFCGMPKWSTDGNKIAYTRKPAYSGEASNSGLYIIDSGCLKTNNCENLRHGPFTLMNTYAWSPDGQYLAGISKGELTIYKFAANGLTQVNTPNHIGTAESMVWSPDGKYLGISPIIGKAYKYIIDDKQLVELKLPPNARLRGWVYLP